MNRLRYYLLCAVLVAGCGPGTAESVDLPETGHSPIAVDVDEEARRAKSAIAELAASLQAELKRAMQEGGPVNAIAVCNSKAGPIAESVASEQGLQLGRVSLRNRNPANAPSSWQRLVLKSFENRKAAGEDPAGLSWMEVAEIQGRQQFRFMKAIPTSPLCLQCHGSAIAPDVSARLNELYPQDKATGFAEGDIRGAFVVTRTVTE
jgi:hypothetical protein